MAKDNQKTKIVRDKKGNELVMLRVDKTLKEMMREEPSSRWDPDYWHVKYDLIMQKLHSLNLELMGFKGVIKIMTNGNRDREWAKNRREGIRFIQVINVLNTGVDFSAGDPRKHYALKGGLGDPGRSRLKNGDILLLSGATGSLGRVTIIWKVLEPTNVSQDVNIIRLKEKIPILKTYFVVYLLTDFGRDQIERHSKGVSGQIKVTFDQIKSVLIPVLSEKIQEEIDIEYRNMSRLHSKAMESREKGDGKAYQENLATAEKALKDLVARTEAVVKGKRKAI